MTEQSTARDSTGAIVMIAVGGMMVMATMVSSIMPAIFALGTETSAGTTETIAEPFSGMIFHATTAIGVLLTTYGIFQLYFVNATAGQPSKSNPNSSRSFPKVLKRSANSIRDYLDRPGIPSDHPLRLLPDVLNDLAVLESGIPSKKRSLVTLAATQIEQSISDDKNVRTQGPNPALASDIVEKLSTLRDELGRDDTEKVDRTLSVLSGQLDRL